jgi:uncharacterized protein (TIGR02147 family)
MDYRMFLKEHFAYLKALDPAFSQRKFSRNISETFAESGHLTAIIKGRKNLTQDLRMKLAHEIGFRDKAFDYFNILVQYNQANPEEKHLFFQQLAKFKESAVRILSEGECKLYSQWYYCVVWNLFGIHTNQRNPAEIAKLITPPITTSQAEEAIRHLLELKLIVKTANGYAVNKDRHLDTPKQYNSAEKEIWGMTLKQWHGQFMEMAPRMLQQESPERRCYDTLVFTVSPSRFVKVKERVQDFLDEMRELLNNDRDEDRVCTLSVQLFPNTREKSAP